MTVLVAIEGVETADGRLIRRHALVGPGKVQVRSEGEWVGERRLWCEDGRWLIDGDEPHGAVDLVDVTAEWGDGIMTVTRARIGAVTLLPNAWT